MQVTYDGAHSILIGDPVNKQYRPSDYIDTWKDWHLIPKELPIIAPPEVQTDLIQIPGTNGSVDLTDALLGYPLYNNRSGSLDFYVDTSETGWTWDEAYDTILNAIHGYKKRLILKDVPSWFYEGRLTVNSFKSERVTSIITLDYDFAPFKRMLFTTAFDDWLWDPFDFQNGIIPNKDLFVMTVPPNSSSDWFELPAIMTGTMPVVPTLKVFINDEVGWDTMHEQPPSFTMYENENTSPHFEYFTSDDVTSSSELTTILEHYNPSFTIGRPMSGYKIKYRFENRFKDTNGDYVAAQFLFDFRPGRL